MKRSRRDVLRAFAASLAALAPAASSGGCRVDPRAPASLWFCYGGDNRTTLLALIDRFHKEQDRVRIEATYQGDYFEGLAKLRTAIAAGAPPALTHVIGEVIPYLAEAGVLETLSSFGDLTDLDQDLMPALAQAGGFAGGGDRPLVALPFNRSTPIAYYNTAIFKELGLEPPTTWDELRHVARASTKRSNGSVDRWGFECPVDWWFWLALVGQAGGTIIGADGAPLLGGEAGIQALELWQTMVHEDQAMKPPPGRDYTSWQNANIDFASGRAAMIWNSTAFLNSFKRQKELPFACAPLPGLVKRSVPTGGTMFVMPRGAPRPAQEAAFAFLRWMMLPQQAEEWATKTGYIPISRAAIAGLSARGYYRDNPNDHVAIAQLADASPWPWSPNVFRIEREAVQPRLEEAVLTRRSAREMLDEARRVALEP